MGERLGGAGEAGSGDESGDVGFEVLIGADEVSHSTAQSGDASLMDSVASAGRAE
nr:hypothetical protein [Saccharothrix sp. ST-888]